MVYKRAELHAKKSLHRRANPAGVGRLLIMTTTLALLLMGAGLLWWLGFALLGLILLAIGNIGQRWWSVSSLCAILAAVAFWHLDFIPIWIAATFLGIAAVQFTASLALARP